MSKTITPSPGKERTWDDRNCIISSCMLSARVAIIFSTAFSSVSLNVSTIIFLILPPTFDVIMDNCLFLS